MKLPIKLTWEDDEWIFLDADDVRIGGMDAMMDLVGDLVVQRDALVAVLDDIFSEVGSGSDLDWHLRISGRAVDIKAALALAKGTDGQD